MNILSHNGFECLSEDAICIRYSYRGYHFVCSQLTGRYFHRGRCIGDNSEEAKKTLDIWADYRLYE
jgi:hypothetical protein